MEYQALYRAWRPRTFSDMIGQEGVTRTLRRQVTTGHIAHAYLFTGTRGTGKTTAARVLARAINCLSPMDGDPCGQCEACRALSEENAVDLIEIDAASNNGVDDVRSLLEKVGYLPAVAKYKVYIIDEVHMLSTGAFNALLKTLEEPPKHVVFILATTEPRKLPATILSRCQRFDFHRFSIAEVSGRLRTVLQGIGRDAEEGALAEIARSSEGTMRDALNLLDVCLSYTEGAVTEELALEVLGTTGRRLVRDFAEALLSFDAAAAFRCVDELSRTGGDPQLFIRDASDFFRSMLLAKHMKQGLAELLDVPQEEAEGIARLADSAEESQILRDMDLFLQAEQDVKFASSARTVLELAAARACHPEREEDAALSERLKKIELQLAGGKIVASAPAAKPAPRQEAPKPRAAAPKRDGAPAAEPPQEFLAAVAAIGQETPSIARAVQEMRFVAVDGDVIRVSFPSQALMFQKILEKKIDSLNEAFSQAFGRSVRLDMSGSARAKAQQPQGNLSRSTLARALDVFDRENLEITD